MQMASMVHDSQPSSAWNISRVSLTHTGGVHVHGGHCYRNSCSISHLRVNGAPSAALCVRGVTGHVVVSHLAVHGARAMPEQYAVEFSGVEHLEVSHVRILDAAGGAISISEQSHTIVD